MSRVLSLQGLPTEKASHESGLLRGSTVSATCTFTGNLGR